MNGPNLRRTTIGNHNVRKINVNTDLKVVLKNFLTSQFTDRPDTDLLEDYSRGMDAVTKSVAKRMRLFGSNGKS